MVRLISVLVAMFVFALSASVRAEQVWGPANCPTATTSGAVNWNGVERQLFTAGLVGCFENTDGDCDPDGSALRLRNIGLVTMWVRFLSNGDVWRIMPGDTLRLRLNNGGGSVFIETRTCSGTRHSSTYERRLLVDVPRYAVLPVGGTTRYSLTVPATQYVRIILESNAFDAYLRLYHNGELIAVNDDSSDNTLNSEIFQFLPVGVYSVEVSSYENRGGGSYILLAR